MENSILKTHIKTKWKYQLLGIFISLVLSIVIITVASQPTKKEKVGIFFTCYTTSYDFDDYFKSITPSYLEIIELNVKHKEDTYFGTVIKGYRKYADIIIVPESKIDYILFNNCLLITDELMDDLTTKEYEYYSKDGLNYGIKVYSKDNSKGILEDMVIFNKDGSDEDCYMFINKSSIHMGKYTNSKYEGALMIIKEILKYEAKGSE